MSALNLRRSSSLAVTSLMMAAACNIVWAGPTNVPFKANIASQETLGVDPDRCPSTYVLGTTVGKGTASHLGAVTMLATDCPLLMPGVAPTFSNGQLTLTAANGDELRATYSGGLLPVAGTAGLFTISGPLTITGGTGRFTHASGSGLLQGSIILGPLVSQGQYQVTAILSY